MVRRFFTLELALSLAVLSLALQFIWLGAEVWLNLPRPGKQVAVTDDHLRYLLYLPKNYQSDTTEWPLLIFLHGSGERGYDLDKLRSCGPARRINDGEDFPFVVATPQCPPESRWTSEMIRALADDLTERYQVSRCYLTGYSMGGYGVWRAASDMPSRFAAIAPLCGAGDAASAKNLTSLPIWAFHGERDQVVPLEDQKILVDAVIEAGGNAKLTVYPEAGHGISRQTYSNPELYQWLLRQK